VSYDAELLGQLIDEGTPPAKRIAVVTGVSCDTVYAYRHGRIKHIPMRFWRDLFAATKDLRILSLITGGVPVSTCVLSDIPRIANEQTAVQSVIDAIGKFHKQQEYVSRIISDGVIDQTDAAAVRGYNASYGEFCSHNWALHLAINEAFSKSFQGVN